MHDETFLVTQGNRSAGKITRLGTDVSPGKMQFHGLRGNTIVADLGDYVTVPTRAPHTFSNPYDEEAKFFNTYTPAHYINYFKLLATLGEAVRFIR